MTRLFRLGGAQAIAALAFGTKSVPRADPSWGRATSYVAAAKNYVSSEVGIDMHAGPSEILVLSGSGRPAWLAADLIAQAEHDPDARAVLVTWKRRLAMAVRSEVTRQMPTSGPAPLSLASHGGIIVTASRADGISLANRMAPEHLVVDDEKTAAAVGRAGAIFIGEWTAQVAGDYAIGSNHVLPTGGAARFRGGLNAADYVRIVSVQRVTKAGLRRLAPTVRALARAEGLLAHEQSILVRESSNTYHRPAPTGDGLRLHLNENTAGCSPKVLEALAHLSATDVAFYPDYDAVYREAAAYLGVPEDRLLLVNGLDEGILMSAIGALLRRPDDGSRPEFIVVNPAFDMYAITARACGGAVVNVSPRGDFEFPLDGVRAAITPRTRLVFVTSPNNPTGVRVSNDAIRSVAQAVPAGALIFVDEAYHDFCGDTALPLLDSCHNVVVGRTFAKAHGLAALRVGALMGVPDTMDPLRAVTPPYSLNVAAAVALRAAMTDRDRLARMRDQVRQSQLAMSSARSTASRSGSVALTSCSRASVPRLAAGVAAGRGGHPHPRQVGRPGVRWLHPSRRDRRAHAPLPRRHGGDAVDAGDRSQDDRDRDSVALTPRGAAATRSRPASVPGPHARAFARHGASDPEMMRRGSRRRSAPHRRRPGIALGEAVSKALGARRGINRASYFVMPMDETLAVVALDLGGRPHAAVDLKVKVRRVGDLQSELVHDFFEGFAIGARANVHAKVLYGRSSHHHVEAIFKAFARALRVACSKDKQLAKALPSTKGLI